MGRCAPARALFLRVGQSALCGGEIPSQEQREQVRLIADLGKSGGTLDFVCAWFLKAGAYLSDVSHGARIAFVSTNSITQGEQVAQLWPLLFDRYGLEISFAHRTFEWGSDVRGKAHVHVVIVGLDKAEQARADRRLFSYPDIKADPVETTHRAISPYLFDASGLKDPHLVVSPSSWPMSAEVSAVQNGSIAADGGNLVFDSSRRDQILSLEPDLEKFILPFIGGEDLIHGTQRFCFWLVDAPFEVFAKSKILREVLAAVREMRLASSKEATREKANSPALFTERRQPQCGHYLDIPRTSSDRRNYIPIAYLSHNIVAANDLQIVPQASLIDFAVVASSAHVGWARITSGRLKSDIRYSTKFTYNTFPLPPAKDLSKLDPLAQAVLDARAAHPGATLADLYDPDLMPPNLRKAHTDLDRAVDRLYRPSGFASDRERVEHLFGLYEAMIAPLLAAPAKKKRARKS